MEGQGSITCSYFPHNCLAFFVVRPAPWTPTRDWDPRFEDALFVLADQSDRGGRISGSPTGVPKTLAPGRYTIAIGQADISDVAGSSPVVPLMNKRISCDREIVVPAGTNMVMVRVEFDRPCVIDVTFDPAR